RGPRRGRERIGAETQRPGAGGRGPALSSRSNRRSVLAPRRPSCGGVCLLVCPIHHPVGVSSLTVTFRGAERGQAGATEARRALGSTLPVASTAEGASRSS